MGVGKSRLDSTWLLPLTRFFVFLWKRLTCLFVTRLDIIKMMSLQYDKLTRQNHWNSATATLQNNSSISSSIAVVLIASTVKGRTYLCQSHSTGKKNFINRIIKSTHLFISSSSHTKLDIKARGTSIGVACLILSAPYSLLCYPTPLSKKSSQTHITSNSSSINYNKEKSRITSNGVLNIETARFLLLSSRSKTGSNHLISSISLSSTQEIEEASKALFSLIGVYFISFCAT